MSEAISAFILFITIAFVLAAWVTHVVYTIRRDDWKLLTIGAILGPVGVIHGVLIWMDYNKIKPTDTAHNLNAEKMGAHHE